MKKLIMVALVAAAVSGCAQQSFSVNKAITATPQQVTTHHFFVSGIGQSKQIDAAQVCGGADKVVRTEVQQTFVNGLLGFVTFGIYTPREARVYCAK
ncbi:Bor family protein [Enterobacter bugandensis]